MCIKSKSLRLAVILILKGKVIFFVYSYLSFAYGYFEHFTFDLLCKLVNPHAIEALKKTEDYIDEIIVKFSLTMATI